MAVKLAALLPGEDERTFSASAARPTQQVQQFRNLLVNLIFAGASCDEAKTRIDRLFNSWKSQPCQAQGRAPFSINPLEALEDIDRKDLALRGA